MLTVESAEEYLANGWPRHCDYEMEIRTGEDTPEVGAVRMPSFDQEGPREEPESFDVELNPRRRRGS